MIRPDPRGSSEQTSLYLPNSKSGTLEAEQSSALSMGAGLRRASLTFMERSLEPGTVLRVLDPLTHLPQPCEVLLVMPFYK